MLNKQACKYIYKAVYNSNNHSSSFSSVGSLFHARGAATQKTLSPNCRRVCGMMRLPHNATEA